MTEPKLQPRRDLMDGYVLNPHGATVGDAVHSADISIPGYRQALTAAGYEVLTQYNMNEKAPDLRTTPPTLELCQKVLDAVDARKSEALEYLDMELADNRDELENGDLSRGDRSFFRERVRALERKYRHIAEEEVTAEELYKAFLREDAALRASLIPEDMRNMLDALQREKEVAAVLG